MRTLCRAAAARLASDEGGMTLLELLVVLQLMAILVAIAVPTYYGFSDRTYRSAAETNAKDLVVAAKLYWNVNYEGSPRDPDGGTSTSDTGYEGMSIVGLKTVDASIGSNEYVNNSGTEATGVTARAPLDAGDFCVYAAEGRWFAYQKDDGGSITATTDPTAVCT